MKIDRREPKPQASEAEVAEWRRKRHRALFLPVVVKARRYRRGSLVAMQRAGLRARDERPMHKKLGWICACAAVVIE